MNQKENSKCNKIVNNLKKVLKNKKYRSLLLLFCYFLFFLILFLLVNIEDKDKEEISYENNEQVHLFSDYNNYEFSTTININNDIYNLEGKRYKTKYEFVYQNEKYNFDVDVINSDENLIVEIKDAFKYNPILIGKLIDNGELVSEKKVISDSSIIYEYEIDLEKYLKICNIEIDEVLSYNLPNNYIDDKLLINITKKDGKVISVQLDLSDIYKYFNSSYLIYKISINYNNVGNVIEF